jgi:integrase
MRKTTTRLTKTKIDGHTYYCVVWPKIGRGRNRQFFKSAGRGKNDPGKLEAGEFLKQKLIEQENYGTAGLSFTETQRSEYRESTEALKPYGKSLRDAVAFYLPHLQATNRTCTPAELTKEFVKAKKADGKSKRYLSDLQSRLGQFGKAFEAKKVAEITTTDVEDWLRSLEVGPTTRNNFRRVLMVAFGYAVQRGYCAANPITKTAKAKEIEGTVGILTTSQTKKLLEASPSKLVPFVAISAFAGLRRAEMERLDWSDIDFDEGQIKVTPEKAKSARRRFIKIHDNLSAWLRPFAKNTGPVTPSNYRELMDTARESAGITDWPQNALRHGFASYHLAHFKNPPELTIEMGHTNANMLYQHYRHVVRPKDAAQYWEINPPMKPGNVVAFGKAAA